MRTKVIVHVHTTKDASTPRDVVQGINMVKANLGIASSSVGRGDYAVAEENLRSAKNDINGLLVSLRGLK